MDFRTPSLPARADADNSLPALVSRDRTMHIAIVSDIHYASPAEAARRHTMLDPIRGSLRRALVRLYRRWLWLQDPFAHNYQLDRFLARAGAADLVVANGDYSCDSAYVGVMDDAACESARTCLGQLRQRLGERLRATIGDHEFGKKMLGADAGGLRLASVRRCEAELNLEPFWQLELGRYMLMGVTSTLVALPVYEPEALPDERNEWRERHAQHLDLICHAFEKLRPDQRVLLFCHDPTALPFLSKLDAVRTRLDQIERTIIGHLHSPAVLRQGTLLSGMPAIGFLGHTILRTSKALREARHWKVFRPLLCPSPAGIQLLKDGGYLTADLDPDVSHSAQFTFRPLPWER